MKTFVVGFLSFHENELHLERVTASSREEAMLICLSRRGYEMEETVAEAIKKEAYDCDCQVEAIEV